MGALLASLSASGRAGAREHGALHTQPRAAKTHVTALEGQWGAHGAAHTAQPQGARGGAPTAGDGLCDLDRHVDGQARDGP